jgi:hypothetical protein
MVLLAGATGGILTGVAAAPDNPVTNQHAQAATAWTVLSLAADNNLEIALAVSTKWVSRRHGRGNIVVQIDRAEGAVSNDSWTARRYLVPTIPAFARSDRKSGRIAELTRATGSLVDLPRAINTYPAERYALIIWDHGGSWLSERCCADGDGLTLLNSACPRSDHPDDRDRPVRAGRV